MSRGLDGTHRRRGETVLSSTPGQLAPALVRGVAAGDLTELSEFLTTARRVSRALNTVLAEEGLREDAWRVLYCLQERPGLPMGELAEALVLPNATASRLVNELIEMGLLFRRPGQDRRVIVTYLSQAGADRLVRVAALMAARLTPELGQAPQSFHG